MPILILFGKKSRSCCLALKGCPLCSVTWCSLVDWHPALSLESGSYSWGGPLTEHEEQPWQNTEVSSADGITYHMRALWGVLPELITPPFSSFCRIQKLHLTIHANRLTDSMWAEIQNTPDLLTEVADQLRLQSQTAGFKSWFNPSQAWYS
jgi:hypothetical protein